MSLYRAILIAAALAGTLLLSCSKAVPAPEAEAPDDGCYMTFNIGTPETRIAGMPADAAEKAVQRVAYVIYNSSNKRIGTELINPCGSSFTVYLKRSTAYKLQVFVNYDTQRFTSSFLTGTNMFTSPTWINSTTVTNFMYRLQTATPDCLPMYGYAEFTTSEYGTGSVDVSVERTISRVKVGTIRINMTENQIAGRTLTLKRIYITNAPTYTRFAGTLYVPDATSSDNWYNQKGFRGNSMAVTALDDMLAQQNIDQVLYSGSVISSGYYFYAIPNARDGDSTSSTFSQRHSRLVIEMSLNSKTFYYVMTLPVMERNMTYNYDMITINGIGSTTPETTTQNGTVSYKFAVTLDSWDTTYNVSETS